MQYYYTVYFNSMLLHTVLSYNTTTHRTAIYYLYTVLYIYKCVCVCFCARASVCVCVRACVCVSVLTGTVITAAVRGGSVFATVSILNLYKEGGVAIQNIGGMEEGGQG